MSADAKTGESEIAASIREMLDGFREAGMLLTANGEIETKPVPAGDRIDSVPIVPAADEPQG